MQMVAIIVARKHIKGNGDAIMKRYVTYDIKDGNSYDELYSYFEERKAKKITESTYQVNSTLNLDNFCTKLKNLTSNGDHVAVITWNKTDGIFDRKVR